MKWNEFRFRKCTEWNRNFTDLQMSGILSHLPLHTSLHLSNTE